MEHIALRIVTNGFKIRIQSLVRTCTKEYSLNDRYLIGTVFDKYINASDYIKTEEDWYFVDDKLAIRDRYWMDEPYKAYHAENPVEFDTKLEALELIVLRLGEKGLDLVEDHWWPV